MSPLALLSVAAELLSASPKLRQAATFAAYGVAGCVLLGLVWYSGRQSCRMEAKMAGLQATIAAQRADINSAGKARDDANARTTAIEKDADAQRKADDETISTLKLAAGCGFEPFPGRVRKDDLAAAAGARSAAGAGSADEGTAGAGAGSDVPVSVVRRRWLPWQRP